MSNTIDIKIVWSETANKHLVEYNFCFYLNPNPSKEESLARAKETINSTLDFLREAGFQIQPQDVTYSDSKIYTVGESDCYGNQIEEIYFTEPHKHVIYRCKNMNGVGFELFYSPKDKPDMSILNAKLAEIYNLLTSDERYPYLGRIANGINEFLLSGNKKTTIILDALKQSIISVKEKQEQIKYLSSCGLCVLAVISINVIMWLLNHFNVTNIDTALLDIAVWSACGGLLSTALSSAKMKIELLSPPGFYIKTGAVRILIAIIGGWTAYFALKSNLVLGFFSHSIEGLFLVSIAAGFSENIITSILKQVESHSGSTSAKG